MNQLTAKNTMLLSTAGAPAVTDVITTTNVVMINPKAKSISTPEMGNGRLGNEKTMINDDYVTADLKVDVNTKSSGALGVVPKYAQLFKACGLSETISAGASVTYAPTSSFLSATALAYMDGAKREVTGIAGTFTFGGTVGEIPKFSFSLKGFTHLEEVTEANPTVTLDTNSNLVIKSITAVTIGGGSIDMESFSFDMGCDVQETYATNRKEFYIQDYKPTMKITAIKTKGNFTHWSELQNNTKKSVKIVLGDVSGDIIEFTAPYCAPSDVSESDDKGKVKYDRTWACENSVGNDNFSIVYK